MFIEKRQKGIIESEEVISNSAILSDSHEMISII